MVTRTVITNIVDATAKSAGLKTNEALWLKSWAAKWTKDWMTKAEYTPTTVLTMTKNAAGFAAKGAA